MAHTTGSIATRTASVDRCTIHTADGGYVSTGTAVRIERPAAVEIRVTELTEPGALLMAFVGRGVRRFILTFGTTHAAEAELLGTNWQPSGRRWCRFALVAGHAERPEDGIG